LGVPADWASGGLRLNQAPTLHYRCLPHHHLTWRLFPSRSCSSWLRLVVRAWPSGCIFVLPFCRTVWAGRWQPNDAQATALLHSGRWMRWTILNAAWRARMPRILPATAAERASCGYPACAFRLPAHAPSLPARVCLPRTLPFCAVLAAPGCFCAKPRLGFALPFVTGGGLQNIFTFHLHHHYPPLPLYYTLPAFSSRRDGLYVSAGAVWRHRARGPLFYYYFSACQHTYRPLLPSPLNGAWRVCATWVAFSV